MGSQSTNAGPTSRCAMTALALMRQRQRQSKRPQHSSSVRSEPLIVPSIPPCTPLRNKQTKRANFLNYRLTPGCAFTGLLRNEPSMLTFGLLIVEIEQKIESKKSDFCECQVQLLLTLFDIEM